MLLAAAQIFFVALFLNIAFAQFYGGIIHGPVIYDAIGWEFGLGDGKQHFEARADVIF
jgi:hypothetical protein